MSGLDLNQLLALLSVVLAAVALPPSGAVIVLAFALGLLSGAKARQPPAAH
jgi:hypothetical protein